MRRRSAHALEIQNGGPLGLTRRPRPSAGSVRDAGCVPGKRANYPAPRGCGQASSSPRAAAAGRLPCGNCAPSPSVTATRSVTVGSSRNRPDRPHVRRRCRGVGGERNISRGRAVKPCDGAGHAPGPIHNRRFERPLAERRHGGTVPTFAPTRCPRTAHPPAVAVAMRPLSTSRRSGREFRRDRSHRRSRIAQQR